MQFLRLLNQIRANDEPMKRLCHLCVANENRKLKRIVIEKRADMFSYSPFCLCLINYGKLLWNAKRATRAGQDLMSSDARWKHSDLLSLPLTSSTVIEREGWGLHSKTVLITIQGKEATARENSDMWSKRETYNGKLFAISFGRLEAHRVLLLRNWDLLSKAIFFWKLSKFALKVSHVLWRKQKKLKFIWRGCVTSLNNLGLFTIALWQPAKTFRTTTKFVSARSFETGSCVIAATACVSGNVKQK